MSTIASSSVAAPRSWRNLIHRFAGADSALRIENVRSRRVVLAVLSVGCLAIALLVLQSNEIIYDEPFHLTNVYQLKSEGLTEKFLEGTPYSAPGPLYAMVHALFEPLTHLQNPGMRFVNLGCFFLFLWVFHGIVKRNGSVRPVMVTLSVIAVPVCWVVGGLALTEAPALLCATLSVRALLSADDEERRARRLLLGAVAGVTLALAILGRQIYLVMLPLNLLFVFRDRLRLPALVATGCAVLFSLPLFLSWGGLISPVFNHLPRGLNFENLLLSFGFTGIMLALIAPSAYVPLFKSPRAPFVWACTGLIVVLNLVHPIYERCWVQPFAAKLFDDVAMTVYVRLCGAALIVAATWFAFGLSHLLWAARRNVMTLYFGFAALALALTPVNIAFAWAVRYIVPAIPFLLLLVAPMLRANLYAAARYAAGVAMGFVLLSSYHTYHLEASPKAIKEYGIVLKKAPPEVSGVSSQGFAPQVLEERVVSLEGAEASLNKP